MIIVLEGVMGSGKTYEAVAYHILPILKQGRKVITNIPLKREMFAAWYGFQMLDLIEVREDYIKEDGTYHVAFSDVNDFRDEWVHPVTKQKPLYVVDEAHIPFTTSRSDRMHDLFIDASLSRRNGNDWILLTQNLDNIYKPIAKLIQAVHYMKKRVTLGKYGSYYHFVYDGHTRGKRYITKQVRHYDPDIFLLYESHFGGSVDEAQMNVSTFRTWKAFAPTFIMIFVLSLLMYLVYVFLWKDDVKTPEILTSDSSEPLQLEQTDNKKLTKVDYINEYTKNNPPSPKPVPVQSTNNTVQQKNEHDKQYVKINDDMLSNEVLNIAQTEQTIYERKPLNDYNLYRKAPLSNYRIQILGNMFNPKTKEIDIYYGVWSETGTMEHYKLSDLVKMNYNIMIVSDCMQLIDHPNINEPFYITCHVPTFESKGNATNTESSNGAAVARENMLKAFEFK